MVWWTWIWLMSSLVWSALKSAESLQWPAGKYGIPKPVMGCPRADGFQWMAGWRSQDTNNNLSKNRKSISFHLDGAVDVKKVNRSFCLKTATMTDLNRTTWPPGQYCVYKKGPDCPAGLKNGFVYWDDDDLVNGNDNGGNLPDGVYDTNTKIEFCCQSDGNKNDPVLLPTETPFYLFPYKSPICQMVKWAVLTLEWIYYDTEDFSNDDNRGGAYPYDASTKHPTLYYCYYRGCNRTLTSVNGTFHSPNFPNKKSDGMYCAWKIKGIPGTRIHLQFSNFSLHIQNETEKLIVYDGDDVTGMVLGVFYGSLLPPRKGIYSSSNHLLVIFVSNAIASLSGFNASYFAKEMATSAPTNVTTAKRPEVKSSTTTMATTVQSSKSTTAETSASDDPTKEGEKKNQRKKSDEKSVNVIAVAIPLVGLVMLASFFGAAFLYWKRNRRRQRGNGNSGQAVYFRPMEAETRTSVGNPFYNQTVKPIDTFKDEGESYSNFTKERTSCFENADELYADVQEGEGEIKNGTYTEQHNENPLYESSGNDTMGNPIYDRFVAVDVKGAKEVGVPLERRMRRRELFAQRYFS
ncbi:uncharacterized protein [Montipora foliosa]|uniref:uncharacterized protein isoform X2 n=1 Tax=Montipora foliosa TaxID=591990 RepID=UPI0035F17636